MDKPNVKNLSLPSRKSVDEALKVIEGFRDMCKHQFDLGYWATIDFPSKHHINKILQLGYRNRADLVEFYGEGLVNHVYGVLPMARSYLSFIRGGQTSKPQGLMNEQLESKR